MVLSILKDNGWIDKNTDLSELFDGLDEITSETDTPKDDNEPDNHEIIFNSFHNLSPEKVKVLIIGQDPYPDTRKAHGLAFSFKDGNIPPKDSLINIFKKINHDLDIDNQYTNLTCWREQGVLLLNTALTFKKEQDKNEQAKSREKHLQFWKNFINYAIEKLLAEKMNSNEPLVIMLWGGKANALKSLKYKSIEDDLELEKTKNIKIIRSSHPSKMMQACDRAIFNNTVPAFNDDNYTPFKTCNEFLSSKGCEQIDWTTFCCE